MIGRPTILEGAEIRKLQVRVINDIKIVKNFWSNVPLNMNKKDYKNCHFISFIYDKNLAIQKPGVPISLSENGDNISIVILNSTVMDIEYKKDEVIGHVYFIRVKENS